MALQAHRRIDNVNFKLGTTPGLENTPAILCTKDFVLTPPYYGTVVSSSLIFGLRSPYENTSLDSGSAHLQQLVSLATQITALRLLQWLLGPLYHDFL